MGKPISPWAKLAQVPTDGSGDALESKLSPDDSLLATLGLSQMPSGGPQNLDPALMSKAASEPPTPDAGMGPPAPQSPPRGAQGSPMASIQASNARATARRESEGSKIQDILGKLMAPDNLTEDMKQQLEQVKNQDVHDFKHLDLTPLLAMTNPELARIYTAPQTAAQHQAQVLGLEGQVAQRETDRSKSAMQALAEMYKADKEMAPMAAMMQQRQDASMHARNIGDMKKDSLLNGYVKQNGNLSNALNQVDQTPLVENGVKMITKPQFDELQQAVRANLGIKGQTGVGERESTYLKPLDMELAAMESRWGSNPKGIPITDPNIQHILSLARTEQSNVQKLAGQRIDSRSKGFQHIYDNNPELANDLQDFKTGLMGQFQGGGQAPGGQVAGAGGQPKLTFEQYKKLKAEGKI